jgi:hypothetical protein
MTCPSERVQVIAVAQSDAYEGFLECVNSDRTRLDLCPQSSYVSLQMMCNTDK